MFYNNGKVIAEAGTYREKMISPAVPGDGKGPPWRELCPECQHRENSYFLVAPKSNEMEM